MGWIFFALSFVIPTFFLLISFIILFSKPKYNRKFLAYRSLKSLSSEILWKEAQKKFVISLLTTSLLLYFTSIPLALFINDNLSKIIITFIFTIFFQIILIILSFLWTELSLNNFYKKQKKKNFKSLDDITLEEMSLSYCKMLDSFKKEYLASSSNLVGGGPLKEYDNMEKYTLAISNIKDGISLPKGYVETTQFIALKSYNKIIGVLQLRHNLNNPYIKEYVGHISFCVLPSYRDKGFGKKILSLALLEAKKKGLNRILLTAEENNLKALGVILSCKGEFERDTKIPGNTFSIKRYWVNL